MTLNEKKRNNRASLRRRFRMEIPTFRVLESLESRLFMSVSQGDEGEGAGLHAPGLCACSACTGLAAIDYSLAAQEAETTGPAGPSAATSYTATGVPIYHSLSTATAKLYLDFDGHFESTWGTYRNLSSPAYDTDGNTASYSATELGNIQQIWARVAED